MPISQAIQTSAGVADWTSRVAQTTTVVASPATNAETIIASVTIPTNWVNLSGVLLLGWAAYTVGTSGASVQFQIRQTNVSGSVIANTGALTGSQHGAGILSDDNVQGFDASPPASNVYKLTMTVGSGAATSTVSAVSLVAICL